MAAVRLPEELITEILTRLPVKSLLRLRAVSGHWRSLISSPSFINSHLRRAIAKTDDNLILTEEEDVDSISQIHLNSAQIHVTDLELPYSEGDFSFAPRVSLVGCCNGIVCVAVSVSNLISLRTDFSKLYNPDIYLWNPATKHSKLISPNTIRTGIMSVSRTLRTDITSVFHGFGFDSITNDFKVVRFVRVGKSCNIKSCAEIYSSNDNIWRVVQYGLADIPFDGVFVCVKGVLCCLGFYGLIIFDLNTEVFGCVKFPFFTSYVPNFTVFKSSVVVIDNSLNIWRLADECLCGGTEESWNLIFSLDVAFAVPCFYLYLNSGDILLHTDRSYGGWYLYNLEKKESKPVQVPGPRGPVFKYSETLVSITGSRQVKRNAHADDN